MKGKGTPKSAVSRGTVPAGQAACMLISRLSHCGQVDGHVLQGKELEFCLGKSSPGGVNNSPSSYFSSCNKGGILSVGTKKKRKKKGNNMPSEGEVQESKKFRKEEGWERVRDKRRINKERH